MPSLSTLRAFEVMAHSKSFSEAARHLNVTQAAIAQQVRRLEAELGAPLTKRKGRSVDLTPEGSRLAESLSAGLELIAKALVEFKEVQQDRPIQMAASVFVAQSLVLPRLHEFWAEYPGVEVMIRPSQKSPDIIDNGFDLAIRATEGEPDWSGLDTEFLVESDIIAVGSDKFVNANMLPLTELPWIWARNVDYEERTMRAFGLDPGTLQNFDIGAPSLQLHLAREGLGVTLATEMVVRDDLASGRLHKIPISSPQSVRYFIVTPKGPVRPVVTQFTSWLKDIAFQISKPG
ncbi:MAG: LysR substrate-binding domain-containing protein [Paracoccaceae bacterium]